jgi:D-sedoheptulose 7-phosphate isomerase
MKAATLSLRDSILRKNGESAAVQEKFFLAEADRIVDCAGAMNEAFARGGRLFVFGNGGSHCDAQHLAVEFMHPIFEKRAALPAVAVMSEPALLTAIGNDTDFSLAFATQLRLQARPDDIALGISTSGKSAGATRAFEAAHELGLLRIGFTGKDGGAFPELCDYCFTVPSFSIHRIQEAHVALLHLIWDTIHVLRGAEDVL